MKIDLNYFPGFTRKAITFTMDDGNVRLDEKFIEIIKPYGFLGTFNLSDIRADYTHEDYRRIYDGYEIANHCLNHPLALDDNIEYIFSDEVYNDDTAVEDGKTLYRDENTDGIWWLKNSANRWGRLRYARAEDYIRFIEAAQEKLEAVFGKGAIGAFVWPYGKQWKNKAVCEYLRNSDFYAVRATGNLGDSGGFDMPADRGDWVYNAGYRNLLEMARRFDAYADDGKLKLFAFGIHSHDYENNNCWDDMREFARTCGNRPHDFWYATNREIFEYEDAVKSVVISDGELINPTDKKLYVKINDKKYILGANERIDAKDIA